LAATHLWGLVTHCVLWGSITIKQRKDLGVKINLAAQTCNCKLHCFVTWQIGKSDSAFYQITLMFVQVRSQYGTDRQTDRQTDRPSDKLRNAAHRAVT